MSQLAAQAPARATAQATAIDTLVAALTAAGLRAEGDWRNEKINYKVREHSLAKVPVILAVGHREEAERSVSLRRLGEKESRSLPLADAVAELAAEAVPPDLR